MARFLVVDDDAAAVKGLSRLLQDDGHEVTGFTKPHDALSALSRDAFDVVVTDLEMPLIQGDAIVRTAREKHPRACIVVVSSRAKENSRRLADLGACIVADKPLDYATVVRCLEACRARAATTEHAHAYYLDPFIS